MAKTSILVALLVAAAAMFMTTVAAPSPAPAQAPSAGGDCMAGLKICFTALNGTKPPAECCDAMKTAVETQLQCLCGFFNNPQLLANFHLTPETALLIPQQCGLNAGPSMCFATSPSGAQAPSPGSPSSGNAVGAKLAGTGLAGIFLVTISMIFY